MTKSLRFPTLAEGDRSSKPRSQMHRDEALELVEGTRSGLNPSCEDFPRGAYSCINLHVAQPTLPLNPRSFSGQDVLTASLWACTALFSSHLPTLEAEQKGERDKLAQSMPTHGPQTF